MTIVLLVLGLVLLVMGAEVLVRGASGLAAAAGISPLIIGLTVVAFGTSAPEMVVSVVSGLSGQPDIAVGNVIGSNVFNVLLILGASALIAPLVVSHQLVRLDVPLMIGASVVVLLMGMDGRIGRLEGVVLFAAILLYTGFLIRMSRRSSALAADDVEVPAGPTSTLRGVLFVVAGLTLLVLGSHWLVQSAVTIAQQIGVSELIIGLTIVAAGTSLPELATSIVAALRGERDIAVGNVVGSNLFNLLAVLGLAGMVTPGGLLVSNAARTFDLPVMTAVAVACLPVFLSGHVIKRWEGALFVGYYIAYTLYLILDATGHDALPLFSSAMLGFVIPLTVITLLVVLVRAVREPRA